MRLNLVDLSFAETTLKPDLEFTLKTPTFCNSDSIPLTSESLNSDKSKRQVPLIQKAKLKTSSVFGSTLNLFNTQTPKETEKRLIPDSLEQAKAQNQLGHSTDTNFTAAMELFKVFDGVILKMINNIKHIFFFGFRKNAQES